MGGGGGGGGGNFYLGPTLTSCSDNSVNNQASTHCLTKQLRWDDLIQVVFNRALASSVGVKDCTLTSKDYFLGKTYNVFGTLKKHFKTSLAEYWGSGCGGVWCMIGQDTSRTTSPLIHLALTVLVSKLSCFTVCVGH